MTMESHPVRRSAAAAHRRRTQIFLAYALIAPVFLWRAAVVVSPFLHAVAQSLTNESPMHPPTRWVGLHNFQEMFRDPAVIQTLTFTGVFTVASTALQILYGMGIAMLLNSAFRGKALLSAVNLLPWAMPGIVIGTAAGWIFNSQYGMIDDLLVRVFHVRPIWLADPTMARVAVILVDVWKNAPWAAIILLAGLQNIPAELYEAARVDGASAWGTFRLIVLPLLAPLLIILTIFIATSRVLTFDLVYGLTQGGPGNATSLLPYQVYTAAFSSLDFGYASAIAIFTFAIVLVLSLVGYAILRRNER